MSLSKRVAIFIVVVALGCAHVATVGAQSVATPFHVKGGGVFASGMPLVPGVRVIFQATGIAGRLGKYTTAEATFTLESLSISSTGVVTGAFQQALVFVAANGDRLAFSSDGFPGTFTGQLSADGQTVVDVTFDASLSPDPALSTGRFSNVTGDTVLLVMTVDAMSLTSSSPGFTAPFGFTWEGEGSLEFG
jgi:hypothetical protein